MPDLSFLPDLLAWLPFESMQPRFMRQALLGILLLCPMAAMLGVQVLNFRMAFFSDAVGHSAFAGLAVGLILGAPPRQWGFLSWPCREKAAFPPMRRSALFSRLW